LGKGSPSVLKVGNIRKIMTMGRPERKYASFAARRQPGRRLGLIPAFAALLALAPFTGLRAQPAPPLAIAVRSEVQGHESRLTFTLQSCVQAESYLLETPNRAILDLPEVNFQIDPREGLPEPAPKPQKHRHRASAKETDSAKATPGPAAGAGLIASYRFGRLAPGKSRVVVDLTGPASIVSTSCAPSPGAFELTLTLAPASEAAFKAAARAGSEKQARATVQSAPPAPLPPSAGAQKPVIVLDPGHGGVDTGALGREHAIEKYVVLDFAKALGAKLRARGSYRVVFTREDDSFVSLGQRVRIARNLNAALFVSVHADALARDGDEVQGATVYTVSDRASDAEAARVAEHENKADSAAGEEAKEDASDVNDILFELTRRETRAYSHVVARSLTNYWKVAARLNKNPRRSAGFVVLKAPDVPSILLELGYLSNEEDVADLTSPAWREKATEQAAKAIDAFFAQRQPEKQPEIQPENQPENLAPTPDAPALKATQSTGN
jgi:N-acetylmuramoyl-L-alanine amidase